MLSQHGCLARQARFVTRLEEQGLAAALVSHPRDIYYLTGILADNRNFGTPSLLFVAPGQRSWLATWARGQPAVDDLLVYAPDVGSTMNPDNLARQAALVTDRAASHQGLGTIGYQAEHLPRSLAAAFDRAAAPAGWQPADEILTDLQLRKDIDEIDCLRATIATTLAGYRCAAESILPGTSELAVYSACQAAAQQASGYPHYYGGDFLSGEAGGPARDRLAERGEFYIVDAQADVSGFWSDMSRAWVVGGQPTDLQASVYDHLARLLLDVPRLVRAGRDTCDFWNELDARIREHPHLADRGLIHHGGHGVGLRAHEGPDINRDRGGTFQVGNVFTCEPGGYSDNLRRGVRLENMFLLTESGVETLSEFPLSPVPGPT